MATCYLYNHKNGLIILISYKSDDIIYIYRYYSFFKYETRTRFNCFFRIEVSLQFEKL